MATYSKQIKRGKDGRITRYVGRNLKGQAVKFHLGFDLAVADRRAKLIQALWEENCQREMPNPSHLSLTWGNDFLEAARAIAKGDSPKLPPSVHAHSDPAEYLSDLRDIQDVTGTSWAAMNEDLKAQGVEALKASIQGARKDLSGRKDREATGTALAEAFSQFEDAIRKQFHQPDGSIKPTGKKLVDQIKGCQRLLAEAFTVKDGQMVERDLLKLDLCYFDLSICQEAYDCIRSRPLSHRSGKTKRLSFPAAQNMTKCITRFFDWLDQSELDWQEPPKFRKIKKTIEPLTAEELFEKEQAKELSVIPLEHLQIISQYCRPNERVLLLLGLNCAFGEGEVGQLRIPFVKTNELKGIRFKTGNPTRHYLWDETAAALNETIRERPLIKPDKQIVFVTSTGHPMWKPTLRGNYSNGIANRWNRVISRVRKDDPSIPAYSFNKLRKTAATNILRLCSAESASMILAHKTLSDDELLECYVQTPWEKLYEAQRKWGKEILPLIRPNPLHINIGGGGLSVKQVAKIKELHDGGMSRARIAKELQITWMTVNRTIKAFGDDRSVAGDGH